MTIADVVRSLNSLNSESTIYAAEPWMGESEAIVAFGPDSGRLPAEAVRASFTYFLEVFIAREVLEDWVRKTLPTLEEKCARLIQYAINDA